MPAQPDPTTDRLAEIEAAIFTARCAYLRATWAGHDGEAEHYERRVDELLDEFTRVRAGQHAHH